MSQYRDIQMPKLGESLAKDGLAILLHIEYLGKYIHIYLSRLN
jgi:hypothetical protein